jgi:hypothetical protein
MRKHIITIASALSAAILLASCEDNRREFMPDVLAYIPKGPIVAETTYNLDDDPKTIQLWGILAGNVKGEGTVWFELDEEVLRKYNETLYEDERLTMLPADCFTFDKNNRYYLSSNMQQAPFEFTYTPDKIARLAYGQRYALPVKLHADGVATNPDKDHAVVVFNILEPTVRLANTATLTELAPNLVTNTGLGTDIRAEVDFVPEESYDLKVAAVGPNGTSVAEAVAAYNAANGTDYQVLPTANYTLPTDFKLEPGTSETSVYLSLKDTDKMMDGEYMIPVTLVSAVKTAGGDPLAIVESQSTCYITVWITSPRQWLTTAQDKAGWTVINSFSATHDNDSWRNNRLIDGLLDTYVGISYNVTDGPTEARPEWWAIDLGREYNIGGVVLSSRRAGVTAARVRFYVASQAPSGDPATQTGIYAPILYTGAPQGMDNVFSGTYKPLTDDAAVWGSPVGTEIRDLVGSQDREMVMRRTYRARYLLVYVVGGAKNFALAEVGIQTTMD